MNCCAKCTAENADTFVRGQWLCPVCLAEDADHWHSYALTVEADRDHWKQRSEELEALAGDTVTYAAALGVSRQLVAAWEPIVKAAVAWPGGIDDIAGAIRACPKELLP